MDAAHARGLAVFLDVVYNHFGPEGNYLHRYAPGFFNPRHQTPWGDGVNYDGPGSEVVRAFMIHNALYWIEEYHLDGLRLDAVNAIVDESPRHLLVELARAVADGPGRERRVHLVLENGANEARYLRREAGRRPLYQAQWNDDVHHALHVLLTGESRRLLRRLPAAAGHTSGAASPRASRSRASGRSYRDGARGEPCADLPPTAFVGFLQNHDQIGNRALGERIAALAGPDAVRAATAVLLLSPALPLLFMGEEWAAPEPFLFFSDLGPDLGPLVSEGRRREFARFPGVRRSRDAGAHSGSPGRVHVQALGARLASRDRRGPQGLVRIPPGPARVTGPGHRAAARGRAGAGRLVEGPRRTPRSRSRGRSRPARCGSSPTWARRRCRTTGPGADWGRRLYALALPSPSWSTLPPWSVAFYLAGARP